MTNSPNAMPGAFTFHTSRDSAVAPPRLSGAKSHIFQPPRTPGTSASSSLILTRSTPSVMSLSSAGDRNGVSKFAPRKRNLEEYNSGTTTPRNDGHRNEYAGMEDTVEGWIPGSPQPFVNTRYQLAGGMDTPSLAAAHAIEAHDYGDLEYRKSLGDSKPPLMFNAEGSSYFPDEPAWYEHNGRPRLSSVYTSPRGDGWSKTAFQVANVVVGKVWEFCKNSTAVFKGFQAGGGTRYRINPLESEVQFEAVEQHKSWQEKNGDRESTPLPGQYPIEELEYIPNYLDRATPDHTPPRPSKRRQISANFTSAETKEELTKNWVIVPPAAPPAPVVTPARPQSKGLSRYSMPTASSASRRAIANTSVHRPASRAGVAGPVSRRPALVSQASRVSHAGPAALSGGRGASYASPRSPQLSGSKIPRRTGSPLAHVRNGGGSIGSNPESPAAKEAKRWAALKRKEEREADESIRRLDAQLKAMIREGKEALGTKIEVELGDETDNGLGNSRKWAM